MRYLIATLLALVAVPSWAGGGWVQWSRDRDLDTHKSTEWEISRGFESKAECEADYSEAAQTMKKIYNRPGDMVRESGGKIYIQTTDGKNSIYELWCLPAGTDPRPRCEK